MPDFDPVAIIEAAYRLGVSGEEWMKGLLRVVRPMWDDGLGVGMFEVELDEQGRPKIGTSHFASNAADLYESVVISMNQDIDNARASQAYRPEVIHATLSEVMAPVIADFREDPTYKKFAHPLGFYDFLAVKIADPSGTLLVMGAPLREIATTSESARYTWSRLAAHIAAAYRLRRESGPVDPEADEVDAILSLDGKLEHVFHEALSGEGPSVDSLEAAAEAIGRARGEMRRATPAEAVELWKALVDARYSLVEHVDTDGKKMLLACRNEVVAGEPPGLSPRERQVVQFAAMGHSDRLIAYELGLSAHTVEALLARGLDKLQLESRGELIRLWQRVQPPENAD